MPNRTLRRETPLRAPKKPARPQPSVDIVQLIATPKTRALGDTLMKADLEKGNANGVLEYSELRFLDAGSRSRAATLMMSPHSPEARPSTAVVAPEKPTALKPMPERYRRYHFRDEALVNKKGLPGDAINWTRNEWTYNPVWASANHQADPALLRVKARVLELTSKSPDLRPTTRQLRNALLKDVKHQLATTGLDARELAFFPAEQALAIVKRLAVAANVDVADVLITVNDAQLRLPAYERRLGDLSAVPIEPYRDPELPRTPAQRELDRQTAASDAAEYKRQLSYFTENPTATLADYSRRQASLEHRRTTDGGFWAKMEAMIRRADVADLAGLR